MLLLAGLAATASLCAAQTPPAGTAQRLAQPPAAAGAGTLVLSAPALWNYAEQLLRDGEYFRAISEYQRLLHFFPASPHARAARLRIGEAHLHGGEPEQAAATFSALLEAPELAPLQPALHYLRGLSRLEEGRDQPYTLREPRIAAALADLRAIPAGWQSEAQVPDFLAAMDAPHGVPSRSPWLAGGLSAVLPGAGSFYVGNSAEGALAFVVNALFISATVTAFRHDKEGLGVVLGVGALAFYGGNIYAATNGAHRFNDQARAAYLAQQRTRFGLVLQPGGLAGVLRF